MRAFYACFMKFCLALNSYINYKNFNQSKFEKIFQTLCSRKDTRKIMNSSSTSRSGSSGKNTTLQMLPIIVALAWPTMLEQLMQTAVQYIDTAMVGTLGTQATAAVGATSTVNWLINSTISAISIGFLSYISQALGAEKTDQAKKAASQAVLISLITGIFFTILTVS